MRGGDIAVPPAAGRAGVPRGEEGRALDVLALTWVGQYDEIWVHGGERDEHREGPWDDYVATRATADELNRAIRAREGTP
jgi:hypothetical protein